jgi:alpha-D-xyloside xylohydrolase
MIGGLAVAYHRAAWNVLGNAGILWARSGFAGSQAYPAAWAGDNEPNFGQENGLPSVIKAGLSIALSGWSIWGSDIGGYQDVNPSSTPENLFMRWTQLGAFSPIMQMHRQVSAGRQYPWSFGADGLENYRRYAQLHTALFPYIYTLAAETGRDGMPIMRPLVLDDPSGAAGVDDEYLFGDAFLVAPMTTNTQTTRQVRLPGGAAWRDYWSGELHPGGQTITFTDADQMHLPLFVRDGAIVPTLFDAPQTLNDAAYVGDPAVATPGSGIEFRVEAATTGGTYTMYEGTQVDSEVGAERVGLTVTSSPARELRFLVVGAPAPVSVTHDGVELPRLAALEDAAEGWTVEGTNVHIRIDHDGAATTSVDLELEAGVGKADGVAPASGSGPASGCQLAAAGSSAAAAGAMLLGLVVLALRRRGRP